MGCRQHVVGKRYGHDSLGHCTQPEPLPRLAILRGDNELSVTVAKEVDLKDALENMGAQMLREVASKTSDTAGDGTTTATALAQAIFREGIKMVVAGAKA